VDKVVELTNFREAEHVAQIGKRNGYASGIFVGKQFGKQTHGRPKRA
jgi:hypothetical protein